MRHQGHADLVGNLERNVERHHPRRARGMQADAHLDADDDIAVGIGHLGRLDRIHQPQFLALADHDPVREAEDAGMRHVQISKDADLARLDHMLAEAGEIAGSGAASVDRRGDAGEAAELLGIDAERGAAPIDMGVEIDQPRRHDELRDVAHLGARVGLEGAADRRHLAAGKGDIGHGIELLGGVDHPPPAQDQVERHRRLRMRQ
ncbi:hypothetical protein BwSH17_77590 [Bradyrhizobium ottawaense]|nr:hypothetical protein BwSH17_77590 [Bradyrhizobium ottawaense]